MEDEIVSFFGWIEKEVQHMEYGTLTVTVMVSRGIPIPSTANIVKQKRKRYKAGNDEKYIDTSANK